MHAYMKKMGKYSVNTTETNKNTKGYYTASIMTNYGKVCMYACFGTYVYISCGSCFSTFFLPMIEQLSVRFMLILYFDFEDN